MRLTKAMLQLFDAQDVCLLRIKDPNTTPEDVARLSTAWVNLEDRKRIMQGRPLPGVIKHGVPRSIGRGRGRTVDSSRLLIDVQDDHAATDVQSGQSGQSDHSNL